MLHTCDVATGDCPVSSVAGASLGMLSWKLISVKVQDVRSDRVMHSGRLLLDASALCTSPHIPSKHEFAVPFHELPCQNSPFSY